MNDINNSNYNTAASISSSPSISSSSKKCLPSVDARRLSSTCIFPKPPWLVSTLHDLEVRMKSLSLIRNIGKDKDHEDQKDEINNVLDDDDDDDDEDEEEEAENTFAERAEIYYLKRPQLLNLLHDIYNNYLSLSDRYCQTLTKLQTHHFTDAITNDCDSDDAGSSLSHQSLSSSSISSASNLDVDTILAELVMKMVENDIIVQELNASEKKWGESLRKTELQASLLEVLESERLVLLSENSRLCVRANESFLMKRMTTEVDVDKDHRMYMLNRRIEDLQEQIRCLQGQLTSGDRLMVMINHHHQSPYYTTTTKGLGWKLENEKMSNFVGCFNDYEGVASTSCSSSSNMGMINGEKKKKTRGMMMMMKKKRELKIGSWWDRFKNFELLLCGIHDDSTAC